ncbi:hypothetical protein HJA76_09780 [Rhizobium bangladeshense]|uniref:hypothetical protein n=1 Tax=Rhizobium bangladeshense TaxID=1138189 RepID=UPI001C83504E|nr:hypothetical protein [Rhizobium bangladeshense]MBX4919997.1 hypothetical protein [Rhizobium bangladeshense]
MTNEDQIRLLKNHKTLAQQKLAALPEGHELPPRDEKRIGELEAQIADLGGIP